MFFENGTGIIPFKTMSKGFGIAVSGGRDNPLFKSKDTSLLNIVPGSSADGLGLLRYVLTL